MKRFHPIAYWLLLAAAGPFAHAQHGTVSTAGTGTAGVHISSDAAFPDVVVKTGNTTTSAFRIFNSANAERMRITAAGNVGIGLIDPSQALEVNGNVRVRPGTGSFSVGDAAPPGYQFFAATAGQGVATALQLRSAYSGPSRSYIGNFGTFGTYISHNRDPQDGLFYDAAASNPSNAGQVVVGDTQRSRLFQITTYVPGPVPPNVVEAVRLVVKYDGKVGIGTVNPTEMLDVQGDINVSGNINAKYQDIAEWVPASSDLAPGTVVVLDAALGNGVMASTTSYDTKVAGVVSAQPGITLGERGPSKEQVATTGRVRVKVDATRAPIAVGDLLVTSDTPGCAMRSIAVDVSGIAMHRPGTIVGKALEALPSGEGEILVLLSLQ